MTPACIAGWAVHLFGEKKDKLMFTDDWAIKILDIDNYMASFLFTNEWPEHVTGEYVSDEHIKEWFLNNPGDAPGRLWVEPDYKDAVRVLRVLGES